MPRFLFPPPWRPLVLLTTLLALAGGCKKKDPEPASTLPSATQTGANTFGCLVDGKAWVPGGYRTLGGQEVKFSVVGQVGHTWPRSGYVSLEATRHDDDKGDSEQIIFALNGCFQPGVYSLNQVSDPYPQVLTFKDQATVSRRIDRGQRVTYITDDTHTGRVTITKLDTVAHIIAGTFEFTAREYGGGTGTVKITDGRFDLNYQNHP